MKKIIFTLVIVLVLALAFGNGITPSYLRSAPAVASGIGAKLLCSARYVSGFSETQALSDLVQYSPILERLTVSFDNNNRSVTTSLYGLAERTASFQEGLGCYTEFDGFDQRQTFQQPLPLPQLSSRWPHGSRVETIREDIQGQLDELIAQDNSEGLNTRALLLVHNGQIIAESYAQETDAFTPVLGWSMAKSLSAVMLGNLEYRGLLNAEQTPVFTQWANDERRDIRLEHLLTMTDGLDFSEEYNPGHDATSMLFTTPSASGYALARPLAHAPGTHFNYSSGSANLLSRLYYQTTGATLTDAMTDYRRHIAVPLGFQNAVFEPDAAGVFVGSSYLYASARDWARLGQMMLNEGVLNGERIVSREWVQRAITPNTSRNGPAYGYQWWLNSGGNSLRWPDLPPDAYAAQGNRQQSITVIPSNDLVVVRLGWTSGRYPINDRIAEMMRWLG